MAPVLLLGGKYRSNLNDKQLHLELVYHLLYSAVQKVITYFTTMDVLNFVAVQMSTDSRPSASY